MTGFDEAHGCLYKSGQDLVRFTLHQKSRQQTLPYRELAAPTTICRLRTSDWATSYLVSKQYLVTDTNSRSRWTGTRVEARAGLVSEL